MEKYEGTFYDQLQSLADRYGEKQALLCEDRAISYTELLHNCELAAVKLLNDGLQIGEKVVIWGCNCIEWVIAFYAVTIAGGTAVLMNYGIHADEAGRLAKIVNSSRLLYGTTNAINQHNNALSVFSETAGIFKEKTFSFSYLTETHDSDTIKSRLKSVNSLVNPHSSQVIIYTTGTTSEPKAVQLSAYSVLNDAIGAYQLLKKHIGRCSCNALPLFHSYGLIVLQVYFYSGRSVYLLPAIKPEIIAELVDRRITDDMASVGAVYAMLTRLPDFTQMVCGKLNLCIVGGGFTIPDEMIRLEKAFGGASILCGYGQTECSPVISVEVPEDSLKTRAYSVGHILPDLDVRVWQKGKGYLPVGQTGEILVKGYCTMNGYYDSSQNDGSIDENGYLHTGDIGYLTEDNMLHLTGRIKEIIVRCGENISPTEIEQVLLSSSGILDAKVIGLPHDIWGESVEACVVMEKKPSNANAEKELSDSILSAIRQKLSSYKIPSHITFFEQFPVTASGKLDRQKLKAMLIKRLSESFES